MLLVPLVAIMCSLMIIGEVRSRKNPEVDWIIERYIISYKYALPSSSPVLVMAYYSRLENRVVMFVTSIATAIWRKISRKRLDLSGKALEELLLNELVEEISVALLHEFAEWGVGHLSPRRLLTHELWNQFFRTSVLGWLRRSSEIEPTRVEYNSPA